MNLLLPEDERDVEDDAPGATQVKREAVQSPLFSSSLPTLERKGGGVVAMDEGEDDAVLVRAGSKRSAPVPGQQGSRILALDQLEELQRTEGVDGAEVVDDGDEGWDGSWGPPEGEEKEAQKGDEEEEAKEGKGQAEPKKKRSKAKAAEAADAVGAASGEAEQGQTPKRGTRRKKGGEEAAPTAASEAEAKPRKKTRK